MFPGSQNALLDALDAFPSTRAIVVFEDDVSFDLRKAWKSVQEGIAEAVKAIEEGGVECVGLGACLSSLPSRERVDERVQDIVSVRTRLRRLSGGGEEDGKRGVQTA